MEKYEELCSALADVRGEYQRYRLEAYELAGQFLSGLREFLGAPDGTVNLFAKFGSFAGRKVDGPASALHLADDAYWRFGVAIDVCEERTQLAYHTVGFDVRLKKIDGQYVIGIDDGPDQPLAMGDQADLQIIYQQMFEFLKGRYRNSFREFLAGDATRRFGF